MSKMRAVQVGKAGAPFELVEREVPSPTAGTVRIKVQACGICHSDLLTKNGLWPGVTFPRVPGHEVVGVLDAVGSGVAGWKEGQRVGVGWHGGSCGYCDPCRRGEFFGCLNGIKITGVTQDGGYADYMIADARALALVPEGLGEVEAAPLMCAGITTFNALRNCGARPGDVVAVLGVGGLGHLGIQYAAKMGFKTVAIARGKEREEMARKFGASHYIDNKTQDAVAELQKLGGARAILATVPDAKAMSGVMAGLGPNGTLMVIGAGGSVEADTGLLIGGCRRIQGWYSGTSIDSQDTLNFSVQTGVRSMNETMPLERAAEAYERMISGEARFRMVLTMGK